MSAFVDGAEFIKSVLPVYRPMFRQEFDILLLWGGRDGGKTHALIQKAFWECVTLPYFRCILVKKTYESIKDSQYQGIKDYIYELGVQDYFSFNTSPISITYKPNGNKFIARGCDKPEKIRGVSNPSHAWYEEGNQLDEKDYINVSTSLRTNDAKIQEWFSFNPEAKGDYEDFWVYDYFFKGKDELNFTATNTLEIEKGGKKKTVELNYLSIHTTYHDNPFVSDKRIARHENLKLTNPHYYRVFTLGLWGNEENNTPYFKPFDRKVHVNDEGFNIEETEDLWFSFDFNLDPCTVVIGQKIPFVGCRVLDVLQNPDGTEALCHELMEVAEYKDHPGLLKVTGDNSGYHGSSVGGKNEAGENINDFFKIVEVISSYRPSFGRGNLVRPNKANRKHVLSRSLCNELYRSGLVQFDGQYCMPLVKEIEKAIPDSTGERLYKNRDKGFEMDMVDAKRYLFNGWFPKQMKDLNAFINEVKELMNQ
jgi:hypothetical protein